MFREKLLDLPRRRKRLLQIAADIVVIWVALWLAFTVRLGTDNLVNPLGGHFWLFAFAPMIAIPVFVCMGMYRTVLRYMGNEALFTIFKAVSLSTLLLALAIYWYRDTSVVVPRSLVLNYWWLSLLLLCGLRLLMRQYFLGSWQGVMSPFYRMDNGLPRVAIYGAGSAGNQLAAALRMGRAMDPVAFLDDDPGIVNRVIAGIKVYSPSRIQEMIDKTGAQEILLAMPSAPRSRKREILEYLEPFALSVRSVPGFMDLASGKVKVDDIQEVDVADLLGRDPVPPMQSLFERCVADQVVMVTGAGGSIGSELCRQVLGQRPVVLILYENTEYSLYSIHVELEGRIHRESLPVTLIPLLGSVRNPNRLSDVMRTWGVNTIYHAAAYKHVPLVEHNITEGILNNVLGTLNTAQAAIRAGVKNFVLISTDKAVRPTNVMGSTKRLAEMVLQALSSESAVVLMGDKMGTPHVNRTRFTMVRFGNVLGSSGSVIPRFREQIRRGGPVTVTHPEITRYFMTIPEAAQLVIQAGSMGQGGDVFVLDMGQPVKILDLAEKMIHLSGLTVLDGQNPSGDIAIEFSGLRPGEKLYEELLIGENVTSTIHPMIMRAEEDYLRWNDLQDGLQALIAAIECDDFSTVRQLLRELVVGYAPDHDIVDWIHLHNKRKLNVPSGGQVLLGDL